MMDHMNAMWGSMTGHLERRWSWHLGVSLLMSCVGSSYKPSYTISMLKHFMKCIDLL